MNDAVAGLVWLLVNGLLAVAVWRMGGRWFPGDGARQRVIHALIIGWAIVAGAGMALGSVGGLTPAALLASVAAVAAGLLGWCRLAEARDRRGVHGESGWSRILVGWDSVPTGSGQRPNLLCMCWTAAWGVLAALLGARLVLDGLTAFPRDWDSLAYHLPLMDHWLRERTLYVPDCAFWYVPANNGLIGLWCVAPFSGDFLFALNNVPTTVLLVVAAVELAKQLRLSPAACHLTGMAVAATQPTVRQIVSAENDVAAAALFLTALVYSLRYLRRRQWADAALGATAAGLLAGVKYYALGYAAVAGAGLLLVLLARQRWTDAGKAAVWGAAGMAIWGGYWYARNFWLTGTPLFPKGFGDSADVWSELRPDSHTSTLLQSGRTEVWPMLAEAVANAGGPIHGAAFLLLPAMLVWLGLSASLPSRRTRLAALRRWWLVGVLALAALVLVATPNIVETAPGALDMLRSKYHPLRLGLCFFSLAVVGLAVMVDDLAGGVARWRSRAVGDGGPARQEASRPWLAAVRRVAWRTWRGGVFAGTAVAVVYQWYVHLQPLVSVEVLLLAVNLFLAVVLVALAASPPLGYRRSATVVVLVGLSLAATWGCQALGQRWHRDYVAHYDGFFRTGVYAQVAALDPDRERIAVCDYRYYPFLGSRRQFDVCRPLWLPDHAALLDYLDDQRVTIVVARPRDPQAKRWYARFHGWISDHPDHFETIHENSEYILVRVKAGGHSFSDR